MKDLDPRLHALRPDMADAALVGRVTAPRFVEARMAQVTGPLVSLRKSPRFDAMQVTEALHGETVKVFDEQEGWAWVQLVRDGYVGYVNANALSSALTEITHRVAVPSTFLYPAASLKSQPAEAITLNAAVAVISEANGFSQVADGRFVFSAHLCPADAPTGDFVAVAELFQHVPYYWGGKSVHGIDCSGLVQLALEATGRAAPRDSDMQESSLGHALPVDAPRDLRRGDLVFWRGHVGIMTNSEYLLHANGFHMMVVEEPLRTAVERIARQYGAMTSIRRL
jgi:cell wall-associated NlpC family hydrolase